MTPSTTSSMTPQQALVRVVAREQLAHDDMLAVMRRILVGETSENLTIALLVALRMRGESIEEIAAAATAVREFMIPVLPREGAPGSASDANADADIPGHNPTDTPTDIPTDTPADDAANDRFVDLCGTGGDGANTFNISTAASFVACAAGARVAKHGNRGVSSGCGSADVLQALGVDIDLAPEQIAACLHEVGMGFMFTPSHHPAMRRLAVARKELGVRTIFNVTGPLANPARAPNQLVGVFDAGLVGTLAEVLRRLGTRRALVVHGHDGLDEISIAGPTHVAELRDGRVTRYDIAPEDFGLARAPLDALRADSLEASRELVLRALSNEPGPVRDIVLLNAGAALYTCGSAGSIESGIALAAQAVASGGAMRKVSEFARFSRSFKQ